MWLARFGEHYRQPISAISVDTYRTELSDLSPEELDAACRHAIRHSEFLPVTATIRNALLAIKSDESYSGPKLEHYEEIDSAERARFLEELERDPAYREAIAALTAKPAASPVKKVLTFVKPARSLDEQKRILRERGFLK